MVSLVALTLILDCLLATQLFNMFGRLTQIAINLVAITTILGGVKRATGYS